MKPSIRRSMRFLKPHLLARLATAKSSSTNLMRRSASAARNGEPWQFNSLHFPHSREVFMSFGSAIFPSDPYRKAWPAEGEGGLVKQLYKAGQFLRGIRVQMRFGELTRAPLRLLRLQMIDDVVECDWLARSPDRWDADLSRNVQQRHASLQALRDAIDVRALLFNLMPEAETVYLSAY